VNLTPLVSAICNMLPSVQAIYSFGSVAAGTDGPQSDIDIAILPAKKLDPIARWEMQTTLARLVNRDVDLIDLSRVSTVMRFQVVGTGKRIYSRDILKSEKFDDLAYSAYLRFNEERKGILNEIQKRGRIYE
jgi:uncharacterized protein